MDIFIEKNDKGEDVVLEVKVSHREGLYRLCVTRTTLEYYGEVLARKCTYPDPSSFCAEVEAGRKSQKKLDAYARTVETHAAAILDLWKAGRYREIYELVKNPPQAQMDLFAA